MRKLVLSSVLSAVLFTTGTAQTLVTIGGQGVSKEDFLKAYYKNNTTEKATEKSYKDYLDLYTRYKLKVRAAYDMRLDTLPGQVVELQNFRAQVAETFMNDAESLDKLVSEAFNRGQKDIHLAHIFIAIPKDASPGDTAKAYEKAMAAYNALKRGKSFSETALAFSEDPSVKDNSGQIGYITVFTLPYELENLAYSTAPGKFSKPFRSRAGYHIFKNLAERKSLGKMKGAQILLPLPPGSTMAVRTDTQLRADSIYKSLLQGADFAQQAKLFSGDNLSYMTGGEMPEFGVGKYDPAFEAAAFGLDKDGEIGRPVLSSYGYHIIKRLARKPFPRQLTKETTAELKQEVMGDPRIEASKNAFLQRIYQQAGLRRSEFQETELWAYTDSALLNKSLSAFPGIDIRTTLFSFIKQQYNVKEWLDYVKSVPNLRARNGNKTDRALFEKYVQAAALEYYRNHLEDYNKDFAFQLTEFKEGNLLFEIMQRKIWDKASTDSSSLKKYYENHRDRYWWEPSADAILFTCSNEKAAEDLKKGLQLNPADWRKTVDAAGATVQADSGRYELAQLQAPGKVSFTPGQFTPFSRSSGTDNAVSFSYIQHIYQERSPRNYLDARGFVINDYQNFLEEQWMTELRKKYIVKVDDSVFGGLSK